MWLAFNCMSVHIRLEAIANHISSIQANKSWNHYTRSILVLLLLSSKCYVLGAGMWPHSQIRLQLPDWSQGMSSSRSMLHYFQIRFCLFIISWFCSMIFFIFYVLYLQATLLSSKQGTYEEFLKALLDAKKQRWKPSKVGSAFFEWPFSEIWLLHCSACMNAHVEDLEIQTEVCFWVILCEPHATGDLVNFTAKCHSPTGKCSTPSWHLSPHLP